MNLTVFSGLALLVSLSVFIEARERVTRGEILQAINNGRSLYANKTQIGNMNELVYDMKLEVIAKKEVEKHGGCVEKTMMMSLDGNLQLFIFNIFSIWFPDSQVMEDMLSESGKTKMAFVRAKCKESQEEDDICIIIMDTDLNIPMLPGKPGSRCPKDRPFNNNGLCATSKGYARKGQRNKGDVKKFANWISYEH